MGLQLDPPGLPPTQGSLGFMKTFQPGWFAPFLQLSLETLKGCGQGLPEALQASNSHHKAHTQPWIPAGTYLCQVFLQ